jgi:hypothetical protein
MEMFLDKEVECKAGIVGTMGTLFNPFFNCLLNNSSVLDSKSDTGLQPSDQRQTSKQHHE